MATGESLNSEDSPYPEKRKPRKRKGLRKVRMLPIFSTRGRLKERRLGGVIAHQKIKSAREDEARTIIFGG